MVKHKFKVKLRNAGSDEIIHEETLFARGEDCLLRGSLHGPERQIHIPRRLYAASHLIPYFDLLHDYKVIEVSAENSIGESYGWFRTRKGLEGLAARGE